MSNDDRHRSMDAARVRAELTVQDLWLRYVALGGTGDAFDLDGFLQGLVPLAGFQQDVLAQALNEALEDDYRTYRIPLSSPLPNDADGVQLSQLIEDLLGDRPPGRKKAEPPATGPG